jgi:hypothetical protein
MSGIVCLPHIFRIINSNGNGAIINLKVAGNSDIVSTAEAAKY